MKILHVTRETGSDARYGIRKSLQPVLTALAAHGHQATVFDKAAARTYPIPTVQRLAAGLYFGYLRNRYGKAAVFYVETVRERVEVTWAAARYAQHAGISHVHCHDPLLAHAFRFFSRGFPSPLRWGYTAHAFGRFVQAREGIPLPDAVARHLQAWELAAARNADWVIFPSRSGLEKLSQELALPKPPCHWHVIPHPRPELPAADGTGIRQRLGVEDKMLMLAVGQLIPIKRFHLLLDVMARLPSPQSHLLILGEGQEENRLHLLAAQYGLTERFHIETADDIAPYLAVADLYVSLSSTEAYGMANCEAIAAGLPSVCSAVGAVPEVVGDGAMLVGESIEEMVAAISRLLASQNDRAMLSARARQKAGEWWDAERVANAMEEVFAYSVRDKT